MYPAPKHRHIISHSAKFQAGKITGDIKDIGSYYLKTKELLLTINLSIYANGNRRNRISAVWYNRIKQSFKHREGTVNMYLSGAFYAFMVYTLRLFRRIKVEGYF